MSEEQTSEDIMAQVPMWQRPIGTRRNPLVASELGGAGFTTPTGGIVNPEVDPNYKARRYELTAPSMENLRNNLSAIRDAIPSWQEAKNIVRNIPSAIYNEVESQMFSGQITPRQALETASGVGLGSLPFRTPEGALRVFGGRQAKGPAAERLKEAERMAAEGATADEIWEQMGAFYGPDDKWRVEIKDDIDTVNFKVKPQSFDLLVESMSKGDTLTLGDVLEHPALYEAYPDLKDVRFVPTHEDPRQGLRGSYTPSIGNEPGTIRVNVPTEEVEILMKKGNLTKEQAEGLIFTNRLRTTLHEIQHDIQEREGFDLGGTPEDFEGPAPLNAEELYAAAQMDKFIQEALHQEVISPDNFELMDVDGDLLITVFDDRGNELVSHPISDFVDNTEALKSAGNKAGSMARLQRLIDDTINMTTMVTVDEMVTLDTIDDVWIQYARLIAEAESRDVAERAFTDTPDKPFLMEPNIPLFRRRSDVDLSVKQ